MKFEFNFIVSMDSLGNIEQQLLGYLINCKNVNITTKKVSTGLKVKITGEQVENPLKIEDLKKGIFGILNTEKIEVN